MALPTSVRAHGRAVVTVISSLALAFAFLIPTARVAAGSPIVVDTTADSLAVDGRCSLREAVLAVNTGTRIDTCRGVAADGTVVLLPGRYVLTIEGRAEDAAATGDLDVRASVTLRGSSAARTMIDANGLDRAIDVRPGASLSLYKVTVTGGNTNPEGQWAAWEAGGGIRNNGTLTVGAATLTGNMAGGAGGGVFST